MSDEHPAEEHDAHPAEERDEDEGSEGATDFRSWFLGIFVVLAVLTVGGFTIFKVLNADNAPPQGLQLADNGSNTGNAPVPTVSCPMGPTPLSRLNLSSDWTSIEIPGCRLIAYITGGTVDVTDGTNTGTLPGNLDFLGTEAEISSGNPQGYYGYCSAATGTVPLNWDCTPLPQNNS